MFEILILIVVVAGLLVIYHHVAYPAVLKLLCKNRMVNSPEYYKRSYTKTELDHDLPRIHLVMPAYNESGCISDKIRNLASVDYPAYKLKISLLCDGCTDDTAEKAKTVLNESECQHLNLEIVEHVDNRGKIAIVNEGVAESNSEIIALSDVSALVSIDALLIAAAYFKDPTVGVVSGAYHILNPGSAGEETYWNYQTAIKLRESATGSTLGVHGAFYMLRRELFIPLPSDTINDDFVLPMQVVAQGYRAIYEPNITALELEQASNQLDQSRRKRIAAGNVQQLIRLWRLLNPKFKGVAFNFASGKSLRVFMPFLLIVLFFGSALLATEYWIFALCFFLQLIVYSIAGYRQCKIEQPMPKLVQTIHYVVSGYFSSLIGTLNYLLGKQRGFWKKSNNF